MASFAEDRFGQSVNGGQPCHFKGMFDQKRKTRGLSIGALNQNQSRTDQAPNGPDATEQTDINHGDQTPAVAKESSDKIRGLCQRLKIWHRQDDFNFQQRNGKEFITDTKEKMLMRVREWHPGTA